MVIQLMGEFTPELLEDFTKDWNTAILSDAAYIDIYLNSPGGYSFIGETIKEMINNMEGEVPVTITAVGDISSAAFNLFFDCKAHKKLTPLSVGMIHLGKLGTNLFDGNLLKEEQVFHRRFSKERLEDLEKRIKRLKLTKEEKKDLRKGKDVYLNRVRLQEILDKDKNNQDFTNPNYSLA